MGTFYYPVEIGDPAGRRFETVEAMVDTGATFSVFPASLLKRIEVEPTDQRIFEYADGRQVALDMAQTWIRIDGRRVITLVVFGDDDTEPLLGAYTLEGLLLAVDPVNQRLVETHGMLKGLR
jgi:clan AA aspartic protease